MGVDNTVGNIGLNREFKSRDPPPRKVEHHGRAFYTATLLYKLINQICTHAFHPIYLTNATKTNADHSYQGPEYPVPSGRGLSLQINCFTV